MDGTPAKARKPLFPSTATMQQAPSAPLFPIFPSTAALPSPPPVPSLFPSAAALFPSAAAAICAAPPPLPPSAGALVPAAAGGGAALPSFSSYPQELVPKPAPPPPVVPVAASARASSSSSDDSDADDRSRRKRKKRGSDREGDKEKDRRKRSDEKKKKKKRKREEREKEKEKEKRRRRDGRGRRRRDEEEDEEARKRTKEEREKELQIERRLMREDVRKPAALWLTEPVESLPVERLYRIDATGDRNNLVFGYLYRGDIPRYSMKRFCLGLRPGERLTFTKSMGYAIGRNDDASAAQIVRYTKPKNLPPAIPAWRRKREEEEMDEDGDRFKSAKNFVAIDVSSDSEGEADEEEVLEDYLTRRSKEFNQRLQQRPKDVQLWLEFIAFQDEYQPLSRRTTTPIVEKKLAIFKKAMGENPESEDLLFGYLNTSAQILEGEKMIFLWEDTIDAHPASVRLWEGYLNFRLSTFTKFTMSAMREVFTSAIQTLREQDAKLLKTKGDDRKRQEIQRAMVDFFVRACAFEKQGGYLERAVALFQGMLELNFFCPSHLTEYNTKLKFLEAFWDSEAPRLGEEGATGWARWLADVMAERPKPPKVKAEKEEAADEELSSLISGGGGESVEDGMRRLYWEFVRVEDQLDKRYWRPAKSTDSDSNAEESDQEEGKDSEEDPERVVLFDDLKYNIFEVADDQLRMQLIFAFLKLLGSDLEGIALLREDARSTAAQASSSSSSSSSSLIAVSSNHVSRKRDFLEREDLGDVFAVLDSLSIAVADGATSMNPADPYATEHKEMWALGQQPHAGVEISERMDTLSTGAGPGRAAALKNRASMWMRNVTTITDPSKLKFIRNVFQSMLKLFPGSTTLAAAYLRFEGGQTNLTEAREAAKSLLSANRTNLPLWNEYAQLEHKSGHLPEARKVYDTALTLQFGLPASARTDAPLLFRHYAEMEFYRPEALAQERTVATGAAASTVATTPSRAEIEVANSVALHVVLSAMEESYASPHPPAPRTKRKKKGAAAAPAPPQPDQPIAIAPTRVLKARNMFQKRIDDERPALHNGAPSMALKNLTVCYALFQYMTLGLDAACQVYEEAFQGFNVALALLDESSAQHEAVLADVEELWESYVRLVYTHSEREATPPGKLRGLLERALRLFPSHRLFLSLYIHWEARTRIEGRLRRFFDDTLQRQNHPVLWLFAIRSEVVRLGSAHRIRSLFERALEKTSDSARCIVLWRYYLRFEVGQHDEAAALRVYYRAINQIPYSKALWLDAFRLFHSTLAERDVSRLLDLMVEKEARLRNDVEEIQTTIGDVLNRLQKKEEKKESMEES